MKTKNLSLVITCLAMTIAFAGYAQEPNKKADAARKDIAKGEKDLAEAKADSVADYKEFKMESLAKIKKNEKEIAALKIKKANANKDIQAKYVKDVAAIEKKNNELKNELEKCNDCNKSRWTLFKEGFNKQMDAVGKSISDMSGNNK